MASSAEHIAHAVELEKLLAHLEKPASLVTPFTRNWIIVLRFYVVLHYLEAFLVTKIQGRRNHETRGDAVDRVPELRGIADDYRTLYDRSVEARYDVEAFTAADLVLYEPLYTNTRASIRKLLNL